MKAPFLRTVKEVGRIKCGFRNRLGEASEQKKSLLLSKSIKGRHFCSFVTALCEISGYDGGENQG